MGSGKMKAVAGSREEDEEVKEYESDKAEEVEDLAEHSVRPMCCGQTSLRQPDLMCQNSMYVELCNVEYKRSRTS